MPQIICEPTERVISFHLFPCKKKKNSIEIHVLDYQSVLAPANHAVYEIKSKWMEGWTLLRVWCQMDGIVHPQRPISGLILEYIQGNLSLMPVLVMQEYFSTN